MILLNRLRNIWAWSAYHPSGNQPKDIGFTWTEWKKPVNIPLPAQMGQIIKLHPKNEDQIEEVLKHE